MLAGQNIVMLIAAALLTPAWAQSTPPSTPTFVPSYGAFNLKGIGCWHEPPAARALPSLYTDDPMTVEKCLTAASGYAFAGLEYGRECWYGNTLHSQTSEAPWYMVAAYCGTACPGDSSEICGGSSGLALYQSDVLPVQPSQPAHVGSYNLVGCVTEATSMRALSAASDASDTMTLETCAAFCSGYTYFGTEYGRECYCGNSLNSGSVSASATDCNMQCAGNGYELCGAGNRLSLYSL